jgi:hypothetical protein
MTKHRTIVPFGAMQIVSIALALSLTSACTPTKPKTEIKKSAPSSAIATLQQVNAAAYGCWPKDSALKAYGIIPELDTTATPRILLVPKGKPQALPQAVITFNGPQLVVFGPLMGGKNAARINKDVARWAKGDNACAV